MMLSVNVVIYLESSAFIPVQEAHPPLLMGRFSGGMRGDGAEQARQKSGADRHAVE